MSFHWTIPLVAAGCNLGLGIFVLRNNPRNDLNKLFALLSLTLVSWNLAIFTLYFASDPQSAIYWSGVFRTGTLLSYAVVLHLMVSFSGSRSRVIWGLLGISYAISLLLVAANAAGLLVSGINRYTWGFYPIGTRLYLLFPLSMCLNFVLTIGILVHAAFKADSPRRRQQAKLWLLGTGIAMPLGLTNVIPMLGIPFYPLGNLANVVFTGIVAYGIVRHRLMDIDIVITKWGSYFLVFLMLIVPAFGLIVWMQSGIFGTVHTDFSVALLCLLMIVAVVFPELRRRTESRIELSFFRERYEHRAALARFADKIVRIVERDRLLNVLSATLLDILKVDRLVVFLMDERQNAYRARTEAGHPVQQRKLASDSSLVACLASRSDLVLVDELGEGRSREAELAAKTMRDNGWELCIPMEASDRLIGIIALGRKRSRDAFSAEEIDLLRTIAAQSAIALENVHLYEELHRSRDIIQRAGRMSALGTLAAGIAHEIRNPLVSIQTFFQLAPKRLHDEEFVTSFSGLADQEVKRIADLVTELLTFARSHDASVQEVELDEAVDRTLKLLGPQAHKQRVTLEKAPGKALPTVHADPDRLKQVLINIILNAIQATKPGGVVSVATRLLDRNGGSFCQIEVQDTGAGIPVELQEDIFNPFFTTKDKGTGLGLSIAHQIISDHGGFISVESREGEGSRFFIHLPVPPNAVEANPFTEDRGSPKGRAASA